MGKWKRVGEFLLEEVAPMLGLIRPLEWHRLLEEIPGDYDRARRRAKRRAKEKRGPKDINSTCDTTRQKKKFRRVWRCSMKEGFLRTRTYLSHTRSSYRRQ